MRAVAAVALASFMAAGCGETLVAVGATITSIGAGGAAIPDKSERDSCDYQDECISFDLTPSINEGAWLLTGIALMIVGVAVVKLRDNGEVEPAAAPPPAPIAQAPEPVVLPEPESYGAVGRWRPVPVVDDDDGDE